MQEDGNYVREKIVDEDGYMITKGRIVCFEKKKDALEYQQDMILTFVKLIDKKLLMNLM